MAFGDLNRINTNLQSLDAQFSLNQTNRDLAETQLRLSTGKQINRAEDDAAGFSIASKLGARIEGLDQGLQNTGDAKSVLDIAEASFDSITDILTELKTNATQAANDSLGSDEREFIQQQMDSLVEELDSLVEQTEFQGQNLLDGEFDATFQVGERTADEDEGTDGDVINVQINHDDDSGFSGEGLELHDGDLGDSVDDGNRALWVTEDGPEDTAHENAQAAIEDIDDALTTVASAVNSIGINQSQLTIREEILTQSINSNEAAQSRIQDADFAAEQSEAVKSQILQQTGISALAQANQAPEAVLGFLG